MSKESIQDKIEQKLSQALADLDKEHGINSNGKRLLSEPVGLAVETLALASALVDLARRSAKYARELSNTQNDQMVYLTQSVFDLGIELNMTGLRTIEGMNANDAYRDARGVE